MAKKKYGSIKHKNDKMYKKNKKLLEIARKLEQEEQDNEKEERIKEIYQELKYKKGLIKIDKNIENKIKQTIIKAKKSNNVINIELFYLINTLENWLKDKKYNPLTYKDIKRRLFN